MTPLAFLGPSLPATAAAGIELHPPAAAGDLLALAAGPPRVVALIDGVFDARAAVQHKEVLELLARGFRVLGAASMGALRAAELHRCGMTGVGALFAAYAAGRLTADDEVAVLHAPAALGHRPLTLPLVDARATLAAAVRARRLTPGEARTLRAIAQARFWRERDWPAVLADARDALPPATIGRLARWLPDGAVSIKARDAALCLAVARTAALPDGALPPPPPRTRFFTALAARRGIALAQPRISSSPSR